MKRIILASGSPRRRELLEQMGYEFEVIKSGVEESISPDTKICDIPKELSGQKAVDVLRNYGDENSVVIGADTIVALDDKVLGKPVDEEDAFEMLRSLSGRSHKVYTGVTLAYYEDCEERQVQFVSETIVNVEELTKEEISSYVATKDCMDKAGSYGIQGTFAKHISGIQGDYFNVVGLPVSMLYKNIKEILKK